MAIPDPTSAKAILRTQMRGMHRHSPADSPAVCHAIHRWLSTRPTLSTIAVFSALPGEPDLTELTRHLLDRRWVYPKVVGNHLTFHAVADPTRDLAPGAFGIMEPVPALAEVPAAEIDAFLCPGLAFDKRGGRLGRGRGFYDRLLATARPDALKIGVCFPHQIVPDTFSETHDIQMDAVIGPDLNLR